MNLSRLVRFAGSCGGYKLSRLITSKNPRILMYHRFSRDAERGHLDAAMFEWQVQYIAKNYKPVTVSELAEDLYLKQCTPRNRIAITIDDGYEDFYEIAWPILKKYGVPATFYVTTGFVSGDLWLWPDQLRYLLEHSPCSTGQFSFSITQINTPIPDEQFEAEYWRINHLMLQADNAEKIRCLNEMAAAWIIDLPKIPPKRYRAVSWNQLEEMQAEGLEVGGHTITHPSLARVSMEEARNEIFGCAEKLRQKLGDSIRSFCYPNGTADDFVGSQVKFIKEAGFSCATVAFADTQGHAQRYAMRRHTGSPDRFQFLKSISGVELLGMQLRNHLVETYYD
ncbi:polysaccharide deacetylase family protein [Marinobacter shengliensis]|uniref:polysaccharide deacetylase family protein n=1 Tax=Marinobacter shengliensis TaxID=1389223 RepID=UPI000D112258|nr:polysaccharide deacetylase family protein [Marinobacter shengliensis]PSF11234.1 polysaccharide deacetylase [Marinobacter shengliensis]